MQTFMNFCLLSMQSMTLGYGLQQGKIYVIYPCMAHSCCLVSGVIITEILKYYSVCLCSMKWVGLKMGQLGVLDNPNYKITVLLDHLTMITVQSDSHGTFDCQSLGLKWAKFPEVRTTQYPFCYIASTNMGIKCFFPPK